VRPETRDAYGPDWAAFARGLKDAAGWRCQCRGECGSAVCSPQCLHVHGQPMRNGKVAVMTVAHLGGDPSTRHDCVVWCAACHLRFDRRQHAETRRAHQVDPGEPMLW
jgi:hypothetical protein